MSKTAEVIEIKPQQIIDYNVTDAAIEAMRQEYGGMLITDTKSYRAVVKAIGEVRSKRLAVEETRKELKKDALEWGRAVDAEAKRIKGMLEPLEKQLKATKQAEDDRKDAIKAEKERKEQERVDGIRKRISGIRGMCVGLAARSATELSSIFAAVDAIDIDDEVFQEFTTEAEAAKKDTWDAVNQALEIRERLDREDAERKAEAERLEKIRKEQEAEAARLEAERKAQEEALAEQRRKLEAAKMEAEREAQEKALAEQKKLEADRRKIEEEKAAIEAAKRAEQERREREEFERQAKIQAEKEAKEKAEREAAEAKDSAEAEAAEKARQEALRPDKEKLKAWADAVNSVPKPACENPTARDLLDSTYISILRTLDHMLEEAEAL